MGRTSRAAAGRLVSKMGALDVAEGLDGDAW